MERYVGREFFGCEFPEGNPFGRAVGEGFCSFFEVLWVKVRENRETDGKEIVLPRLEKNDFHENI